MLRTRSWIVVASTTLVTYNFALAQWSHNPAINLGISTRGSDQNQCKSLAAADGSTYLCWLDGIGSGWDTRVQKLNDRGVKQWGANGILVADTAFSSTQDYGFALDTSGNLLVAYRDDNNSGSPVQIKIQKIDPNGTLLWGSGVQVSTTSGGNAPHCCGTSDGGAAVGWSGSVVHIQKVDSNGVPQWAGEGVSDALASGTPSIADVCAGNNGGVIALYIKGSLPRQLFTRQFDNTGAKAWNNATTPVALFDEVSNGVQAGAAIYIMADGSGGAYYSWYGTGGTRNAYCQHINAAGTEVFPHNGVTIANDVAGRIRISATIDVDFASGDIYMIAKESSSPTQGNYNVIAQRINSAGVRQWNASGVPLFATGADQPVFQWVQSLAGGGAIAGWDNGGFNSQKVFATRLNPDGSFAWTPNVIEACSTLSGKGRLWETANAAHDRVVLTWADNRNAATNDIYGQRVNSDGSLGTPGDVNDDGVVNIDDLVGVITTWGACPAWCASDLTPPPSGDGQVNIDDLVKVIINWG